MQYRFVLAPPTPCEPILDEDQSMVARTRLMSLRKLKNQKVEEGDDLAPVTFTCKIENFSKLDTASKYYSDIFVIGNSKWRILLYYLSPYLDVPDASNCLRGGLDVHNSA